MLANFFLRFLCLFIYFCQICCDNKKIFICFRQNVFILFICHSASFSGGQFSDARSSQSVTFGRHGPRFGVVVVGAGAFQTSNQRRRRPLQGLQQYQMPPCVCMHAAPFPILGHFNAASEFEPATHTE